MKLLSDVSLSESDVNSQLKVNQTISKINTLMDVADGLKEWELLFLVHCLLVVLLSIYGQVKNKINE